MFSYILFVFSSLIFLYPSKDELTKKTYYSAIFGSFIFAYFLLGFVSLTIIFLGVTDLPIIIISLFLLFSIFLTSRKKLKNIKKLKYFLYRDIRNFFNKKVNSFQGKLLNLTVIILVLIYG